MESPKAPESSDNRQKGGIWYRRGDKVVPYSDLPEEEKQRLNERYVADTQAPESASTVEVDPSLYKQDRLNKAVAEAEDTVLRNQRYLHEQTVSPTFDYLGTPEQKQASAAASLRQAHERLGDVQEARDVLGRAGGDPEAAVAMLRQEENVLNEAMRRKTQELSDARASGRSDLVQRLDDERERLIQRREAIGRAIRTIEEV